MARDRTLGLKLRAIDKMSTAIDRVQKRFPKLNRAIRRASTATKIFNAQTKQLRQSLLKVGGGLKSFGRNATFAVTLPLLAAGVAGVKAFGDFEQGLKGVEKTTGISGAALEGLATKFDKLSTEIPVSTAEMLELAQAGGQLGISGVANLEKFTLTMSKLSRASDVAGEEGAKSIARILTVTGTGIDKIDKFSSALVDLGNNAAASESEILEVSNRVAGAIGRFDVGSEKVLGISTALKSLGKQAESSGSVIGRSFDAIDQSIKKGGKQTVILSKLTGIAQADLQQAFQKDSAAVFEKFIQGLGKVQSGGGNLIKVMSALGLQGVRINDILGTLAKNPEVLAENMDRAARAFSENTALEKEFAVQTSTFNSEMKVLTGTFKSLLRLIGKELAPVVSFFGKILKSIFDFLRANPAIRTLVIIFGSLAAVMGPILFAFGFFLTMLPALMAGATALGVALLPLTIKFVLIGAAIAAVIAIVVFLTVKWREFINFLDANPIFSIAKSMFFLLTPIGRLIAGVRLLVSAFDSLDKVKNTVRDILPKFLADKIFGDKTLGPERGARQENKGVAGGKQEGVNGQVGITFANAPKGTRVRSEFAGPIDFNLGFAGGTQ